MYFIILLGVLVQITGKPIYVQKSNDPKMYLKKALK